MTTNNSSSTQVLQNAILWAFIELLDEVKKGNNNMDNLILRDIKAIHHNTTYNDLPDSVKKALSSVTRSSMGYIGSNGYYLANKTK